MKTLMKPLILLFALVFASSFIQAQKKYLCKSEEGKFSIQFPADYATEMEDKESATIYKMSCTVEDQTYFASYTLHKLEMMDHEEMAEVSYDSFLEAVKGEPVSKSAWEVNGHMGLQTVIDMPLNEAKIEYRVLLVGDIQYQIMYIAPYADYKDKKAKAFLDSFKLME